MHFGAWAGHVHRDAWTFVLGYIAARHGASLLPGTGSCFPAVFLPHKRIPLCSGETPPGHGVLRVEPDAHADPHDESTRHHQGHRHARNASSSSATSSLQLDNLWPAAGSDGTVTVLRRKSGTAAAAGGQLDAVAAQQGLSLVAQEVFSRMVSGSRKVAQAPARAVAAAGSGLAAASTTVRQASMTGARAVSSVLRPRSTGSDYSSKSGEGSGSGSQREQPAVAPPVGLGVAALPPLPPHQRARMAHRKTMSLDTGAAAAAQEAAAAALLWQQQGGGGAPAHVSPTKELQRRGSNLAELAAMESMQRSESRVRAPSRFACFTVCGRWPAVKDE